jgi:uncharacterized protein DUF3352
MSMRSLLLLLLAAAAFVAAGCGGDEDGGSATGTDSAATLAPAAAALYLSVETDFESAQWDRLNDLLDRFPGKSRLLDLLTAELAEEGVDLERDVKPAVGPTVEVIALDFEDENNVVGLTKPKDEEKFEQLLAKSDDPPVTREIEGWTVVADTEAVLDRFEEAVEGESLADTERFSDAMDRLPDEALAKLFVNGERATEALREVQPSTTIPARFGRFVAASVAVEAEENGLRVAGFARTEGGEIDPPELGTLVEDVPAGAYAFLNFHGYDGQLDLTDQFRTTPELQNVIAQVERFLGVTIADITTLFNQEGIVYVRPGALIPEVTLVLEVDDEQGAVGVLDRLAQRATGLGGTAPRSRSIGDVQAKELNFGQFSLLYAGFDGRLVVTTQADGIADLRGDGDKLVDESRYEDALDAAGLDAEEEVVLYFDLQKTIDIAEQLAQLADEPLPSDVRANLEPLRSVIAGGRFGKEDSTFNLFVQVE